MLNRPTSRDNAKMFFYTGLFCIGIAIISALRDPDTPIWASFAVSFSIGWSINIAFMVLQDLFNRFMSPYVAPVPITAIGLLMGLMIAGLIVVGRPLFFFTENYITLAMGVFFGIVGFVIFSTHAFLQETRAELALANVERERQEKLLTQTELKLLQAQIEPHFLFNTLSNIAGLIHAKPDIAEKTLVNLTTLLRSSLDRTRKMETTLSQELEIARAYLEIQSTRMSGRLSFTIDHDASLDTLRLPPLIVQPLLENAVKYAIDPREDGGNIWLTTKRTDDTVEIEVRDDGPGFDITGTPNGTGISNVKERIQNLLTGASLKISQHVDNGVTATISIPLATIDF